MHDHAISVEIDLCAENGLFSPQALNMASDGKYLEELVRFVEDKLKPIGFEVTSRECPRDEDGHQTAELDIVIRGLDAGKPVAWLIECRDRPSAGAVGISWIEQLMGRRIRLGFDRVFAVSSTGFSKVAAASAQKWGIELREVEELSSEDFAPLLLTSKLEMFHRSYAIHSVFVQFHQDTSDDSKKLANRILAQALRPGCKNSAVLSFGYQSDCVGLDKLVDEYVLANQLADGVAPGVPKRFSMFCKGEPDRDDNWGVETDLGLVKVAFLTIDFELLVTAETHPLSSSARYRRVDAVAPISQTYSFSVPNYMGQKAEVEFLKLASSGGSYVSIFGNGEKGPVVLMPYTVASPK